MWVQSILDIKVEEEGMTDMIIKLIEHGGEEGMVCVQEEEEEEVTAIIIKHSDQNIGILPVDEEDRQKSVHAVEMNQTGNVQAIALYWQDIAQEIAKSGIG